MNRKQDPELTDNENPEWTENIFKKAMTFSELPQNLQKTLRRVRGPNKLPTKKQVAIRFDDDVLTALRASGKGWQTRVNDAMREWLGLHSP